MTHRFGVFIDRTMVRAVALRRAEEVWHGESDVAPDASVEDALSRVLGSAPAAVRSGATLVAALGPAFARVKRLGGMSHIVDATVMRDVLRSNPDRFFVRRGDASVSLIPWRSRDSWWAAALDDAMVGAAQRTCDTVGIRLIGCIAASPDYPDAAAAVRCPHDAPFLRRVDDRRGQRLRRLALLAACVLGAVGALAAPAAKAELRLRRDTRELDSLRSSVDRWLPEARRLQDANGGLAQVARFARHDRSMTGLLTMLSSALPESTAVVTLRVDSLGGSLLLVSAAAASVVPRLAAARGITDVRVSGPLTREDIAGAQVQRIALRFRLMTGPIAQVQGAR